MKHPINCILFYLFLMLAPAYLRSDTNDILVAVLMIKDEAEVIVSTLEPLVEGGITSFLILDTGSTDDTPTIARTYLETTSTSFYIAQEPFINFAASRNRALELTEQQFPQAEFMLMLDAEWYLHGAKELLSFCKKELEVIPNYNSCYAVHIMSTGIDFYTQRLIRCNRGVHFVGAVHEVPSVWQGIKVSGNIFFEYRPANKGCKKSSLRWERDKDILLNEFHKNPHDPRTTFYLAQTYACLGDWENAALFYQIRTKQKGWDEENFMAQYRYAQALENANYENKDDLWDIALINYLKAYALRPHRAEPLVSIAQHYLNNNQHALAFLFAQRAAQLPYPSQDVLFVEKELYNYTRYNLLGICAWYIDEFEHGEQAVLNALKAHPETPHLYFNMGLYLQRKGFDAHQFAPMIEKMNTPT